MRVEASPRATPGEQPIARCIVVVNVNAGGMRRRPELIRDLAHAVDGRGEIVRTGRIDELQDALRRARASGADAIAICGGDGTNLHTLTAIAKVWGDAPWPRLMLLPGGTLNTAASNLGCSGPAPRLLRRILDRRELRVRRMPLLRVNGRVGLLFGSHMVARILDEYYAGLTGPVGATLLAARIVGSALVSGPLASRIDACEDVTIEIDGGPARTLPMRMLGAGVVPSIAVGMRLMSRAGEDGGFHLVGTMHRAAEFAPDVARVWTGLPLAQLDVDVVAKRAVLRREDGLRYTMDGDMFVDREITLEATPPVEMLLP